MDTSLLEGERKEGRKRLSQYLITWKKQGKGKKGGTEGRREGGTDLIGGIQNNGLAASVLK